MLAAIAVLPAVVLVGATLDAMTEGNGIAGAAAGRWRGIAAQRPHDPAGRSHRGPAVRPVPAACRPAMGIAVRSLRADRAVRCDGARPDQRAVAVGRCRVPRGLRRAGAAAAGALLARPGAVAFRRPRVDCRQPPVWRCARSRRQCGGHLHGHAGTVLPDLAVRARPAVCDAARRKRRRQSTPHRHPHPRSAAAGACAARRSRCATCSSRSSVRRIRPTRGSTRPPTCGCRTAIRERGSWRRSCARSIRTTGSSSPPCWRGSTARISSTRCRRRCSTRTPPTNSCSTRDEAFASTMQARSSCCCAPPEFPRAS